jgi:hypothetical protein
LIVWRWFCIISIQNLDCCAGLGRTRLLGLELVESLVWRVHRQLRCCCGDVLELDPLEVALELANLSAVCIHCVLNTVPLLVDLLDDDL